MSAHDTFSGADAQILDRGYRKYDGERTGERGAILAVTFHSIQRALGMRRSAWAKLLPIATAGFTYLPAIVFIGIVSLFPAADTSELVLPTYGEYYGFVITAIVVFTALAAPEVLCTDRRSGMLGVYLASPLNRDTYLLGKALSIASVLAIVCVGPTVLMFVANVLQSTGPEGWEILDTAWRVLLSGITITLMFTGITMGVASLTDRKAIAAAAIVLLNFVTLSLTGALELGDAPPAALAIAPFTLGLELPLRIDGSSTLIMSGAPSITLWLAWAAWTFGGFALARYQLHKLPVTR